MYNVLCIRYMSLYLYMCMYIYNTSYVIINMLTNQVALITRVNRQIPGRYVLSWDIHVVSGSKHCDTSIYDEQSNKVRFCTSQ